MEKVYGYLYKSYFKESKTKLPGNNVKMKKKMKKKTHLKYG